MIIKYIYRFQHLATITEVFEDTFHAVMFDHAQGRHTEIFEFQEVREDDRDRIIVGAEFTYEEVLGDTKSGQRSHTTEVIFT